MRSAVRFRLSRMSCSLLVAAVIAGSAWAQTSGNANARPAGSSPVPQDLEPGVNTSATSASSDEALPRSAPSVSPAPPPKPVGGTKTPRASRSPQKASPSGDTTAAASTAATASTASGAPKSGAGAPGKAHDRIELDTTQITGNRELPKVLYIVPWKRSDLGDLVGKPVNSLLDEVLTPVDRDVFKRQNRYYDALKPDETRQAAGATAAGAEQKH